MNPIAYLLVRSLLPLLAVPLSCWISCRFLNICDWQDWLLYQWPSYVACYIPLWAFLWMQHIEEQGRDRTHDERVKVGLRALNAVHAGVLLRFAATAAVLFYWKDEKLYKPVYVFLMHMASFFVFQLATLISCKKSASEP
ncbi:MAG: hypothetical protein CVV45_09045 [Spirochaetae bacterium HGW-Spirochaetae-10]|nr:MAG: hypothetical protein CVV45_09045 [Spirochaetae bacterium HGW-Spirochaetae-10]